MRFTEFEIEFKEKIGEIFLLVKGDDIARSNRSGYFHIKTGPNEMFRISECK